MQIWVAGQLLSSIHEIVDTRECLRRVPNGPWLGKRLDPAVQLPSCRSDLAFLMHRPLASFTQ
jgi:hypothetical protein